MEKDIAVAVLKEEEYILEKVFNGNNKANIYDYIRQGGYDDLEDYFRDKFYYAIAECGIESVTDTADVLLPIAYKYYQEGVPFCFFVEYEKPFALVPMSFTNKQIKNFATYGLDCFKCGYEDGGIIITSNEDFRFCISIPKENDCELRLLIRMYETLKKYYPDLVLDGNDYMLNGKKVAGTVHFDYNDMCIFAINVSIIDMSELINEVGITKVKEPGCLTYVENIKNILKSEVESWLQTV